MSSVVLFAASSNTLISSQSTWWWWLQACCSMADFSSSPLLVAALCSLMRVSRALFVSSMYTRPQLHRTWYTTLDFFSSGSRSLTCINCPRRVGADWKIVRMLYHLHTCLTSSLRPATYGMKAVAWGSSVGSTHCTRLAGCSQECFRVPISLQDSSEVLFFCFYVLALSDGSYSVVIKYFFVHRNSLAGVHWNTKQPPVVCYVHVTI